ncbi:hypothetical protein EYF80_023390 [Liparis tanakae]|uniref:Uncharacterized protein n=1 Tax=Liparis tanakae TaxID=230148 RepID=A0A4Z2HLF1_9TELE|nr:hypothetical protein EYF80_023390 [Liparis tanakae]
MQSDVALTRPQTGSRAVVSGLSAVWLPLWPDHVIFMGGRKHAKFILESACRAARGRFPLFISVRSFVIIKQELASCCLGSRPSSKGRLCHRRHDQHALCLAPFILFFTTHFNFLLQSSFLFLPLYLLSSSSRPGATHWQPPADDVDV